jgi:hypothetical protein
MTLNLFSITTSQQPIADQAQAPTPLNRSKRGVADHDKTWPQHSVLKISLLNMTEEQKKLTKDNIKKWAAHTNLFFKFTDSPNGDIRITADNTTSAAWSRVGTDARKTPAYEPTMSIGFANPPASLAAKIQHEFGHALGLRHEHKHPDRTLDFNKEQIYEEYASRGKTRRQANHDIVRPFYRNDVHVSAYDRQSIMHYGFFASLMNDGQEIPKNTQLSQGDKNFIQSLYPADHSILGKLLNTAIKAMVNS